MAQQVLIESVCFFAMSHVDGEALCACSAGDEGTWRWTCGGVKKAVAQVRLSIRFCLASLRGFSNGNWLPAQAVHHSSESSMQRIYTGRCLIDWHKNSIHAHVASPEAV